MRLSTFSALRRDLEHMAGSIGDLAPYIYLTKIFQFQVRDLVRVLVLVFVLALVLVLVHVLVRKLVRFRVRVKLNMAL